MFSIVFKFETEQGPMSDKIRVNQAYDRCLTNLQQEIIQREINPNSFDLHLRVYKVEELLEAWIKNKESKEWALFKQYPFCVNSGKPGPKRKEGDRQIPEGFYHIDRFNPVSKFHLSLGLNYPNEGDRKLGAPHKPGSDVFIHGGCKSVGCIAITDNLIAELYVLASEAKAQRQMEIPVRIFPCKMNGNELLELEKKMPEHSHLWKQLKMEDDYFRDSKKLKPFIIGADGDYQYTSSKY
ncbi:MAG: murein L,D-transpeptidase YafK [Polaribacter sp.]|jgi:murein L,D-transpeptidase YafK